MKLPKKYVIVEIIPSHSNPKMGFIVQLQALKVENDKIIGRLDLRIDESLIDNPDLLNMINYDKEMFIYTKDKDYILEEFKKFIKKDQLLIIDNYYTIDYLKEIKNTKNSVFGYLGLEFSPRVFDELMEKYGLEPSNHLVDLLYEALIFAKNNWLLVIK